MPLAVVSMARGTLVPGASALVLHHHIWVPPGFPAASLLVRCQPWLCFVTFCMWFVPSVIFFCILPLEGRLHVGLLDGSSRSEKSAVPLLDMAPSAEIRA